MTQAGVSTTLSSGFTSFDDDNDYGDDEIDDDKEDIRLVTTNAKLHLKIFKSAIYLNKRNLRRVHKIVSTKGICDGSIKLPQQKESATGP